jgi:hypothetical protein
MPRRPRTQVEESTDAQNNAENTDSEGVRNPGRTAANASKKTGQRDIGLGRRGAMIALHSTGLPFSDIHKIIDVPERSVARLVRQIHQNAAENPNNPDPLADENLRSRHRTGNEVRTLYAGGVVNSK